MRNSILNSQIDANNIFDSHCHLQLEDFDTDRKAVIQRAKAAGIKKILIPAIDLESAKKAVQIAKTDPDYFEVAVGNHPYAADKSTPECIKEFDKLIAENECVTAIGETGLDYFRNLLSKDIQITSFIEHLKLANKYDLPVIIHARETDEVAPIALKLLQQHNIKNAVFHCFSGSQKIAEQIWSQNYKTSFSCNLTYKKNEELRQIFAACPNRLRLIETDSPYLAPQGKRQERNEPANLSQIIKYLTQ